MRRVGAAVVITTASLAVALTPASNAPKAHGAGCPDVEVVFARGTGEPPGVGRVGSALVSSLKQRTRKNVAAYAVNYPASKNFLAAREGANDASAHIKHMTTACPRTRLVLGGYSQGAAVIDIVTTAPIAGLGFDEPLPAEAADHVAAVTLFGNPSARAGSLLTALSPRFGDKILDLCNQGDPICSDGNQWKAHLGYVPGFTNQAASFIAARL